MFYNILKNPFVVHFNERLAVCNSPVTPNPLPVKNEKNIRENVFRMLYRYKFVLLRLEIC